LGDLAVKITVVGKAGKAAGAQAASGIRLDKLQLAHGNQ
jgi:hypothetical protein